MELLKQAALTYNFPRSMESQFNNGLIMISSSQMEHAENIFPSRSDILGLAIYNLRYASHNHVPDTRVPITFHYHLKRPQELFLESEVRKLSLFDEFHGQLTQRVHRKYGNVFV